MLLATLQSSGPPVSPCRATKKKTFWSFLLLICLRLSPIEKIARHCFAHIKPTGGSVHVVVQFYPLFTFYFPLVFDMIMNYSEFETKKNRIESK